MASYYISAITSCTGISPIASYSPDSGLSKDSPDSIEFQFYREIPFCVLNSGHSHKSRCTCIYLITVLYSIYTEIQFCFKFRTYSQVKMYMYIHNTCNSIKQVGMELYIHFSLKVATT